MAGPMHVIMRARVRRMSLLTRFSFLSLLVIVALGIALGMWLQGRIERRALIDAVRLADAIAQVDLEHHLTPADMAAPLTLARLRELDDELAAEAFDAIGIERVKAYDRRGRVVYSDDRTLIGTDESASGAVRAALAGRMVGEIEQGMDHDGSGAATLEAYVPLRLGGEQPDGVLEIYLPYAPVAASIAEESRRLYAVLIVGLALLYGVLWRIVAVASRRLRHQALHDELTGLPNRALLHERAARAIVDVRRQGGTAALLLLDLDRFKEVNDTLGHDHGDELLEEVADRLRHAVRRDDTLARLGGDEFAVLLPDLPNRVAAIELAGRLHDAVARPFALRGVVVALEASIGVAFCPDHAADVTSLVQHADVAMYEAKRARTRIETYTEERDPYSAEKLRLLGELRAAIAAGELVLHYQPKIALDGREVIGVEALVRWQHPRHGLLPPDDFVPLAARTGAIGDLTRWVLDQAIGQCAAWREQGLDLPVAINLAAPNVVDAGLPDAVAGLLERHDVPADRLECEISEHTVMADPQRALDVLERLRGMGVRLSLDDFGTGHASLAYLKRLPLDDVKIDRSFIAGMREDDDDAAIVRSTIDLARNLGLSVIAEGVETEAVVEDLAALGCDVAQGFFFSCALPPADLAGWLSSRRERELPRA